MFMLKTYTQVQIQIVFAVKFRRALIKPEWKEELYKYITGIVRLQGHKMLAINGVEDHIHILIGMKPVQSLSALVQDIKGDSSKWINQKGLVSGRFAWQESFGAFSYSQSHVSNVIHYIQNQEAHHRKKTMVEEYKEVLKKFEVEFDERYIIQPLLDG
jgi:putative transposase